MNNRRSGLHLVCAVLVISAPAQAEVGFSYEKNAFIKFNHCYGVYPGTSLLLKDKVWIFSDNISPIFAEVVHVVPAAPAKMKYDSLGFNKVWNDKPLWADIGCVHSFRGDMPELLARVSPEPEDSSYAGFAIRGLPADVLIAKGPGVSVPINEKGSPYVGMVRHLVTDACYAPDSLIRIRQFPIGKGRSVVQLDIGKAKMVSPEMKRQKIDKEMREHEASHEKWAWPEHRKKILEQMERKNFVESVEICRFFLDGKRVVKSEKISRRTGADERVDTAPDLDTDNWADTTTSAIGFISLNDGKDWDALFVDIGWEGINYSIQRLDGSRFHYSRSLYIHH